VALAIAALAASTSAVGGFAHELIPTAITIMAPINSSADLENRIPPT
jgi:hypothetical protein